MNIGNESIGKDTLFSNEPIPMVYHCTIEALLLDSFKKGALPLIELPFKIDSPPNENGANFFPTIVV